MTRKVSEDHFPLNWRSDASHRCGTNSMRCINPSHILDEMSVRPIPEPFSQTPFVTPPKTLHLRSPSPCPIPTPPLQTTMCRWRQIQDTFTTCNHSLRLADQLVQCDDRFCKFSSSHPPDCGSECRTTCWQYYRSLKPSIP
ncbi:hypothetical protein FA13DRAFT_1203025 [Coprinellus micaceus]|uniref:Uncharacterized protein n=1 Tax=Coprinellus micaceus TaxID=71717 RepID=A0A4Y7TNY7_COPMI|nr:hypothetical protein FA13DRAFT_1203025 [Coprinellus micaceus]